MHNGVLVQVTVTSERGDTFVWPDRWVESHSLSGHNPLYFAQAFDEQMDAAHEVLAGKIKKLYGDIREDHNGEH